jgi:hypothetical protein
LSPEVAEYIRNSRQKKLEEQPKGGYIADAGVERPTPATFRSPTRSMSLSPKGHVSRRTMEKGDEALKPGPQELLAWHVFAFRGNLHHRLFQ